jgi:hypothetical protein
MPVLKRKLAPCWQSARVGQCASLAAPAETPGGRLTRMAGSGHGVEMTARQTEVECVDQCLDRELPGCERAAKIALRRCLAA